MTVAPLGDVVIIRRLPPSQVSDGGVLLAWDEDHKEDIGVVTWAGAGKTVGCKECGTEQVRPLCVSPGDTVLFSTHGHQITHINGEEYVILREPSIIGIVLS